MKDKTDMKKMMMTVVCLTAGLMIVSAQTKTGGISQEMLQQIQKEQQAQPANRALANAIAANSIDALAKNHLNAGAIDTYFSIETPKQSITDQ